MSNYKDTNNIFDYEIADFNISSDFVIVVSDNNEKALKTAKKLQKYFAEAKGISLDIVSDKTDAFANEIIIGAADREEAFKSLRVAQIKVAVVNGKLCFGGGHYVTVDSAVEKFIRMSRKENSVVIFEQETDFTSTIPGGYEYVWGDEFDGEDIDLTKWDFIAKMVGGAPSIDIACDKELVNVEDGKLKLYSIKRTNPDNPTLKYCVPISVVSEKKMNLRYGYAEIKAKMPFFAGAWPSYWTQSTNALGGERNGNYLAEVDIIEAFGQKRIRPGIIKCWPGDKYAFWLGFRKWSEWSWEDRENAEEEYHTYAWEWTPEEMNMYVDGQKYMTFDMVDSFNGDGDMQGFHDPMFIMFNNHLITNDASQVCDHRLDENADNLPGEYFIDWVRVYQKPGVGDLWIDEQPNEYPERK